jgi:hypothetical protein
VYNQPVSTQMRIKVQPRVTKTASLLLAALALSLAGPAQAGDGATEQARAHYETGTQQYDLGHWDEAIREYEKAYELRPDPSFLYNLAQANRRKGDLKRAMDLYKNYLGKLPKGPQRADVEEKIAALQKQIDDAAAKPVAPVPEPAPTAPPPLPPPGPEVPQPAAQSPVTQPAALPVPTPPEQPPSATITTTETAAPVAQPGRTLRIAGIVCGAVGVTVVGTGAIFGLRARSLSTKVTNSSKFNPSDDSAGSRAETMQWVFYGVGAGAVVAGATLYYLGVRATRTAPSSVSLAPVLGPGTVGVAAMGVF